jgi:hypothetical protein
MTTFEDEIREALKVEFDAGNLKEAALRHTLINEVRLVLRNGRKRPDSLNWHNARPCVRAALFEGYCFFGLCLGP